MPPAPAHMRRSTSLDPPAQPRARPSALAPHVFLILPTTPHPLDHLLCLLDADFTLLGDDLPKHYANFTRHIGRVAADVEVATLRQERIDLGRVLAKPVLHVDLRCLCAGICGDERERVTQRGAVGLGMG